MNKRRVAALMISACMGIQSVMAMEVNRNTVKSNHEEVTISSEANAVKESMYMIKTGEITNITKEDGEFEILVGSETDGTRFVLQPQNIILDVKSLEMKKADDLKIGMSVTVVIDKSAPMTMSLPPMCSGQTAVLINSSDKHIEVAYFDDELVNETNTLKLNISNETMIQNSRGERRVFTEEDVKNQDAIVIYTASTRSIPAQTNPEYVLILCKEEEQEAEDSEEYIAVRKVAVKLGYDVKWDNTNKTAYLFDENHEAWLTVGDKSFLYNGKEVIISKSIKLEDNVVYVPEEVLSLLI